MKVDFTSKKPEAKEVGPGMMAIEMDLPPELHISDYPDLESLEPGQKVTFEATVKDVTKRKSQDDDHTSCTFAIDSMTSSEKPKAKKGPDDDVYEAMENDLPKENVADTEEEE